MRGTCTPCGPVEGAAYSAALQAKTTATAAERAKEAAVKRHFAPGSFQASTVNDGMHLLARWGTTAATGSAWRPLFDTTEGGV